jgi:DNA-binding beta-propeller fold protein YncE
MVRTPLATLVWMVAGLLAACAPPAASGAPASLVLERTIALPGVAGRIDHLAFDAAHGRLFVAELGNGTVEAVDVAAGKVVARAGGLHEPQGLAVLSTGELAVASGGDGAVAFLRLADLSPVARLPLGPDADDERVDAAGRLVVGYGAGGLATIDPATRRVVATVALPAHPEGFQLAGGRAYVNLPDAGQIGVVELATGKLAASWPNRGRRWNFPLGVDPRSGAVAVAYRLPARLVLFDPATGTQVQALPTCGDADDLYFDAHRPRLYVSCGDGHVDVLARNGAAWARLALVATGAGARTSLYDPTTDRLYVAARAAGAKPAAILVYRPTP